MPIFTRSSQKQQEKDDRINPISKMGELEENPLHKWNEQKKSKEDLIDDILKEVEQDPQFQLALDKIMERNKEK
jgi:ABC-type dipeptide/oligopeptide/nickel transport system ATPase subunit